MRCVIVLSGEIRDDNAARSWLADAGRLICADGGARHLHRLGVKPDLLVGDFDSINCEDRTWLDSLQVPVRKFPVAKNETDSEIALQITLEGLPEPRGQHEIVVLAAFGDRPDHVLANQLLAAHLAAEGWRLVLTDGIDTLYTLAGGQTLTLDLPTYDQQALAVSAIPAAGPASGVTYASGLLYPLDRANLPLGSTRGVSNRVTASPVVISLEKGVLMVVVTRES